MTRGATLLFGTLGRSLIGAALGWLAMDGAGAFGIGAALGCWFLGRRG
jgi:hypothetical protein